MRDALSLKPTYYEALRRLALQLASVRMGSDHAFLVETRLSSLARSEGFESLDAMVEKLFAVDQARSGRPRSCRLWLSAICVLIVIRLRSMPSSMSLRTIWRISAAADASTFRHMAAGRVRMSIPWQCAQGEPMRLARQISTL